MNDRHDEFLKLFLGNYASLYSYIIARGIPPDSAKDVLQDVAVVLWEKFETYQLGTNFRAWTFAVTRIEIMHFLDRQKRDARVLSLDEETLDSLEAIETSGHEGIADYQEHLLVQCLNRLGEEARRVMQIRYGDGLSFKEMAKRLKKSSTALRIQICRIRKWLQDCVAESLQEAPT